MDAYMGGVKYDPYCLYKNKADFKFSYGELRDNCQVAVE